MSDTVLKAERIGKRYILQHQSSARGFISLREQITARVVSIGRQLASGGHRTDASHEEFWALKDLSMEIRAGDVIGLIGRNGAGKSTLLKIFSRITEPTCGEIRIKGRVASLLEVGTGFHPELTGRENIFLNGAILGMSKAEIRRKFDQIVEFSEIERFLDTPVKRYSSGMYVRLAFAVAAHVEPEILIVDEVLAVGDAAFQKKCLGRMGEAAKDGRTVLFVSHNLGLIRSLCKRGVFLESGSIAFDGEVEPAISAYLKTLEENSSTELAHRTQRRGGGYARLTRLEIRSGSSSQLESGRPATLEFYTTPQLSGMSCSFTIYDAFGQAVAYFDSALQSAADSVDTYGEARFVCELDEVMLVPGRYHINAALTSGGELLDHVEAAAVLDVAEGASRQRAIVAAPGYGSVFMHHRWIRSAGSTAS